MWEHYARAASNRRVTLIGLGDRLPAVIGSPRLAEREGPGFSMRFSEVVGLTAAPGGRGVSVGHACSVPDVNMLGRDLKPSPQPPSPTLPV